MSRRSRFQTRPLFSPSFARKPEPRKASVLRRAGGFFYRNLKRLCMVIGAFFLITTILSGFVASWLSEDAPMRLPDKMVLYLPLEGEFPDYSTSSPYSFTNKPNFRHIINTIDRAQTDKRVKGLLIIPNGGSLTLAQMQELRGAVKRFRSSGKPTWFYAESMDEGLGSYYLAAATDEIWMQPVGTLSIPGLRAELPYARDLLNKIGVEPQFFARKEYKDVFSNFSESAMPDTTRESVTKLLNDIGNQMMTDIAGDRKKTVEQIRADIDRGLMTDQEALASGLVDHLDYLDVLKKNIRLKTVGTEKTDAIKFVRFPHYMDQGGEPVSGDKAKIALVYAVGTIMSDDEMVDARAGAYGGGIASAEDIARDIEESARAESIKAIVLRIDSPGGSPTASETIRRALVQAREKGKKVVVSMGGTAASGGYWIASPADRIFALPATITGSIGVAGGKFVFAGLWDKLGVNWDDVHIGDNSGIRSPNTPYSAQGQERINAMMDSIYDAFISRVAEGRRMEKEDVDRVARGRVWTGASALSAGLVDELGGLNEALDHAAILSGLRSRRDVTVIELPRQKTPLEKLTELLETQARLGQGLSVQAALGEFLAPFLSQYNDAGYMTRTPIVIQ